MISSVLLAQIYDRAAIGIFATIVNAFILVFVLKKVAAPGALMLWFAATLLFALIRYIAAITIRRHSIKPTNIRISKGLLTVGMGVSGVTWGATAIFLFPAHSVAHQVFIAFILSGMVAGAVGVFAPILPAFLSFSIPALTPIFIRFIIAGDEIHMAMAAMTMLFGVLTFTTARHISIETRELVSMKENFSSMLDAKTETLMETNQQLKQEVENRKDTEKTLLDERDKLKQMIVEIKTLRGFIPICASCKKIRDDAGYWQRIEKYIQEHSEAKFSHGICPECARKIYSELNDNGSE